MARKTNEEILNMSLKEAEIYTNLHPAESWRFSKAHGKSAVKLAEKAIKHGFQSGILYANSTTTDITKSAK